MNQQAHTQAASSITKELAVSSAPVEISMDLLQQVSGAGPKGGWIVPPVVVADSFAIEAPGPKGGW